MRRGWSLRDRDNVRHQPLRANDDDAWWTPIACGGGIALPGPQERERVDCPDCVALLSEPSCELREDRQIHMQRNLSKTPNPKREEGPLMLEKPGWEGNLLRCVFYTLLFSAIIWLAIILIVVAVTG